MDAVQQQMSIDTPSPHLHHQPNKTIQNTSSIEWIPYKYVFVTPIFETWFL